MEFFFNIEAYRFFYLSFNLLIYFETHRDVKYQFYHRCLLRQLYEVRKSALWPNTYTLCPLPFGVVGEE